MGNCPGRTWCKAFGEQITGQMQTSQEIHPGKTQKGGKLKRFGKSCGQGSLKISKPGLKGGFSCIEPARFPAPQTHITLLIVLALHPSALTKILCFFHHGKEAL